MVEITLQKLKEAMPYASDANVEKYYPFLVDTMQYFEINTPLRVAHFIAQISHESGSLRYVREIASGAAYEGRKDLGNVNKGDGVRFKGRGLIQLTGRANYAAFFQFLDGEVDVISHPEKVEEPRLAVLAAGWFWNTHGLNKLADEDDLRAITKRINGGYNGLKDREHLLNVAKAIFN